MRAASGRGSRVGPSPVAWRQQQQLQELEAAVWEMPAHDSLASHIRVSVRAFWDQSVVSTKSLCKRVREGG